MLVVPKLSCPFPLHVVVPFRVSVRPPLRNLEVEPLSVSGPLSVVVPVPLIAPPEKVVAPLTVSESEPVSVPPDSANEDVLISSPLLKVKVPLVTDSGPTLCTVAPLLNVRLPPVTWVLDPVML